MKTTISALIVIALFPALAGAAVQSPLKPAELRTSALSKFGVLPAKMPNSEKDTPARVELGKKLFFEKRLSVNDKISCNSCHDINGKAGGVDNEVTSPGAHGKRGDRNSPTVLNAGFFFAQFWDGRAANLREQAKGPILNPVEMEMAGDAEVIKKLKGLPEYPPLFSKAFPDDKDPLTYENLAEAIAAFERTLITRDRFDDFQNGKDDALSAQEQAGLHLVLTLGCTTCHTGPTLGGKSYQKIGLIHEYENKDDHGRAKITKDEDDMYKFKVPTLRNVALTAPYFHDGQSPTLKNTVTRMAHMQLDITLSDDQADALVAFLNSLTDKARVK